MGLTLYLLVCLNGIAPSNICQVYTLTPQYEMTQAEMDGKVEHICEVAYDAALDMGASVTRCELIENDEIPVGVEMFYRT